MARKGGRARWKVLRELARRKLVPALRSDVDGLYPLSIPSWVR